MGFIDLDRLFAPYAKDGEANLAWGPESGRKYGGWLNWSEVLERPRVVLLAEALSGKSEELREQKKLLQSRGRHAFLVRIEELADNGLEVVLDEPDTASFQQWKADLQAPAWFFLDSVDEARLNRKSFDSALKRFAKEIGGERMFRSHVIITCRVSDWRGKADPALIEGILPHAQPSTPTSSIDPDDALLGPIFDSRGTVRHNQQDKAPEPAALLIVQLVPLSTEQKARFAAASKVPDTAHFIQEVERAGLLEMTERPGDLIGLIAYWKTHGRFDTLFAMTEEGIRVKLSEEGASRAGGDQLSYQQAREGAERLAAALVLGKSFTLQAPGQDLDSELSHGALDPRTVLPDWTPSQVGALLRTGIFAPATYGRVRFHQRTTQEFLAAAWFQRLLAGNTPLEDVREVLFVEMYGVKTVRPALRAVGAWLALGNRAIRDEIVLKEPVSLIAHGDPKSLPIADRERLLQVYAELDANGHLNPEMVDHRAAWLFSDRALANAIRQAWSTNGRRDFRRELLRFIEQAPVVECADLARSVALDIAADTYTRIVAVRALTACADVAGLQQLAREARSAPDRLSARLAPAIALALFPTYLSTGDLLELIDRSIPARRYELEGFASHLAELHRLAPDRASAKQFAAGLADLCLRGPYEDDDLELLSKRHANLGSGLAAVAKQELDARAAGDIDAGLLRLLMATERTADEYDSEAQTLLELLSQRVRSDPVLNRQLMWADVAMGRARRSAPVDLLQVGPYSGHRLWAVGLGDIGWLADDASGRAEESDRRVAFSGLFRALSRADALTTHRHVLEAVADSSSILRQDLKEMEAPLPEDPHLGRRLKRKREEEARQAAAKQSWLDFRAVLANSPEVLSNPENFKSWKAGLYRLQALTLWLQRKFGRQAGVARAWRTLTEAFGQRVAEHYRDGMRQAWRHIKAERSVHNGGGAYTTKLTSPLAIEGIEIDHAEATEWARRLTRDEARLAAQHACMAGHSAAVWFQELVALRQTEVSDIVDRAVRVEYASEGVYTNLLNRNGQGQYPASVIVAPRVLKLLKTAEPADQVTFERVLALLLTCRSQVPEEQLLRIVTQRVRQHLDANDQKRALEYFGVYLAIAPEEAMQQLLGWMAKEPDEDDAAWRMRAQTWLGALFADGHRRTPPALHDVSIPLLVQVVKLLYFIAPPQPARDSGETDEPRTRDDIEDARRTTMNALLGRSGAEAFQAIRGLAEDPTFLGDGLRMQELAHGKAETDGDLMAWSPGEVVTFERLGTAPVKTGADLLRVVLGVLSNIAASFLQADASSRSLLELATNEDQVQNWLVERLNERAKGRFHAHREPKVARRNEPDIVVSSAAADVEVAIEVKNGNKDWSLPQLENALRNQLARDYLRTEKRRHGVLLISLHRDRKWVSNGIPLAFEQVINRLQNVASGLTQNETGPIEVVSVGLDSRGNHRPSAASPRRVRAKLA